jgi:hypothetical protein
MEAAVTPLQTHTGPPEPARRVRVAIVVVLLSIYFLLAVGASWDKSAAFDDSAHLMGGITLLRTGDFRVNPENGPLPQAWAALPVAWMKQVQDPRTDPSWNKNANFWDMGRRMYLRFGQDMRWLLIPARAMNTLWGVALGLLIYCIARELFGFAGGVTALCFFVVNPAMLAGAGVITCDLAVSFFFLLSSWLLWRVMHHVTLALLVCTALSLAGLLLSKGSGVLIAPVAAILVVMRLIDGRPLDVQLASWRRTCASRVSIAAAGVAVALTLGVATFAMLWLAYGLRYSAYLGQPPEQFFRGSWSQIIQMLGPGAGKVVGFATEHRLLPEAFLFSIAAAKAFSANRPAFLDGLWSVGGWYHYFPMAMLYKTPVSLLLALLIVPLAGVVRVTQSSSAQRERAIRLWRALYNTAPLWALVLVYGGFAVQSLYNIGHRHLLPMHGPLFVLAGALVLLPMARAIVGSRIAGVFVLVAAMELALVFPDVIAYFNLPSGGASNGYRRLVDSSLDWGQDLPGLAHWLEQNTPPGPDRPPVYLSYFGSVPFDAYGIDAKLLPSYMWSARFGLPKPLEPGIYCISATMLQQIYADPLGPWTVESERAYQSVKELLERYTQSPEGSPERQRITSELGEIGLATALRKHGSLRFGRLCHFLRQREPDAQIGHTILIYKLDEQALHAAIDLPLTGELPARRDALLQR